MANEDITDLKAYLGFDDDETDQDKILRLIWRNTLLQLKFKLGIAGSYPDVPPELAYITLGVAVKRFNRLKNEGMTSYTQEGESITFNANDFDEFADDIDEWKKRNNSSVLTAMDPYRVRGDWQ